MAAPAGQAKSIEKTLTRPTGANIYNPKKQDPEEQALWSAAQSNSGADRADALVQLSHMAHSRKDYAECLALCESAMEIYESLGDAIPSGELAHVYTGISLSLSELDRNKEALDFGSKAIQILEATDSSELLSAYRNMGSFAFYAKDYADSILWYTKALEYVSLSDPEIHKGWDHFYIARNLLRLFLNFEAEKHLLKARQIFKEAHQLRYMAFCDEDLSLVYARLKQAELAKTHAELAMDFAVTTNEEMRIYWSNVRLGRAKYLLGDYLGAYSCYLEAKTWEVNNSNYTYWPHVFYIENCMADCLDAIGNSEEAQEIRRRINSLSESLGMDQEEI